jgi:hypothetical protein
MTDGMISTKLLFIANSLLTFPFGILSLVAPAAIFSSFGIALDSGGQLIAQGYGATLIGYGLVYYFLRDVSNAGIIKSLLIAALVFNLTEAIIQSLAAIRGITLSIIWITVFMHALLTLLCASKLINQKTGIAQ